MTVREMALWQIVTLRQGFSFSLLDTAEQSQCLVGQYHALSHGWCPYLSCLNQHLSELLRLPVSWQVLMYRGIIIPLSFSFDLI